MIMIHPKTLVKREIDEANELKVSILKRAGFIPLEKYRPPKKIVVKPEPTLADEVKSEAVKTDAGAAEIIKVEKATHKRKKKSE